MRPYFNIRTLIFAGIVTTLAACNSTSETEEYYEVGNLAVTSFKLTYDSKVPGLDSAYFAIDLNNGVIYNADSLRAGTPVNKVIPVIKFSSDVIDANITMTGGTTRTGTVNYRTDPTDSIDFTGKVVLTLRSASNQRAYTLKVNVHNEKPDSLVWGEAATSSLPSRMSAPRAQKTVRLDNKSIISLIQESDGTFTRATTADIAAGQWEKQSVSFSFAPRLETLTACGDNMYILGADGTMYKGDGTAWTSTGQNWNNIIGSYLGSIVGLVSDNGVYRFAQYPQGDLNVKTIPTDFPVSGFSNFVTLQNKWTLSPVAFFTGGREQNGTLSPSTWAFDGTEWIRLNDNSLPEMEQASLIPYYYYRIKGSRVDEYNIWMVIGGHKADNTANRSVYISYDNGVHWQNGGTLLQLPDAMPDMWGCDNIVSESSKSSDISDNWTTRYMAPRGPQRITVEVEDNIIKWNCPYIYMIGGYGPSGQLYDTIWRGVLNRLTFTPII